jgi:hypothetical protein
MRIACPICKLDFKVSEIKRHCIVVHRVTENRWRRFLASQTSQSLVNRLESGSLKPIGPVTSNSRVNISETSERHAASSPSGTPPKPTMKELKARIRKLTAELNTIAMRRRAIEETADQHRERQKRARSTKVKRKQTARDRRAFKSRFKVGRGSAAGVPPARFVSGGRVESKG